MGGWTTVGISGLLLVTAGCGGGGAGAPPVTPTDAPPTVLVTRPAGDVEVALGTTVPLQIAYIDDDPDSTATTDLFADADGDLQTTADQVVVATGRPEQDGVEQTVAWNVSGVPAGTYVLYARTSDASKTSVAAAPGSLLVNSPPLLTFSAPLANVVRSRGSTVEVRYTDNDADDTALTWLFADRDGSLDTTTDSYAIVSARPEQNATLHLVRWDTTNVEFGTYRVMGQTWDGTNPLSAATATGRFEVVNAAFGASGGSASGVEQGFGIASYADESCVVVGQYGGDTVFGAGEAGQTTLTAYGAGDVFVARYDGKGFLQWARRAGGTGTDGGFAVTALADGSCVLTGTFVGTATFGEGDVTQTDLTATGSQDAFVARYDASGVLAWAKRAGGSGTAAAGYAIAAFNDGSTAVVGTYVGSLILGPGEGNATTLGYGGGFDAFVARYDQSGALTWAKRISGGGFEEALAVATFADGTFVVTGYFDDQTTWGLGEVNATTLFPYGFQEVFVARYTGAGTLSWVKQQGGFEGIASGLGIATYPDGTCAATGFFAAAMDFGFAEPNETNFFAFGSADSFVARFEANGQLMWARQQGGGANDQGTCLRVLSDGSCAVGGFFEGFASFGFGEPREQYLYSQGTRDVSLARFDANGSLLWATSAGGTSMNAMAFGLTVYGDDSIGLTGSFDDGAILFGPGDNKEWPVFSAGLEDVFVARYNADGGF